MSHNITIESGKSIRLPTAGKYCDRDIVITAEGGAEDLDAILTEQETLIEELKETLRNKATSQSGENEVCFYDYDGTLLYAYTLEEAKAFTELPELPTQPGLICQGWNYDLETIKSYDRPVNIGATYITDDGKTRLYIKIASEGRMTVPLSFSQTVSDGVIIDWGDGTDTQTLSGTGKKSTRHTYTNIGDYVISFKVTSGTLGLGRSSSGNCVMGYTDDEGQVYCSMLQKVEIGSNVTAIDSYAFSYCYSLLNPVIPESVTSIGNYAFNHCHSLSNPVIPESVTSIGNYAFGYCYSLLNVVIPKNVTSINSNTFSYCYSLSNVVISEGVTSIGTKMFYSCYPLSSVVIPKSVTSIGNNAFYDCESLSSVVISEGITSISDSMFRSCKSLLSVVIPKSVTSIGNDAFGFCRSLSSIVIPDGVTNIGATAFAHCSGIAIYDFTQHTAVPTLANTNTFNGIPSDCEIRVPASLYDEWIAATNWSTYAKYIVAV
jgi:hypothetical protein